MPRVAWRPARTGRDPVLRFATFLVLPLALLLGACTAPAPMSQGGPGGPDDHAPFVRGLCTLLPVDLLLIGEQHDAPAHPVLERDAVTALAARSQLAALVLEMAEDGRDTTALSTDATQAQVRAALRWDEAAWPWEDYAPAVMAAVRAGVPVLGANMPRARMKDAMADVSLDAQLGDAARALQQEAVRTGHCNLLPPAQIVPMTRIQIARDRAMAQTIVKARQPGKTVLLIAGSGHALRTLGVPQHLPTDVKVVSVKLFASAAAPAAGSDPEFDQVWQTAPLPEKDYCAGVKRTS